MQQPRTRSSVRTSILDTSNQNSTLLVRLRATSSAPVQLSSQQTHLTVLRESLASQDDEITQLEAAHAFAVRAQRRSALLSPARKLVARATQRLERFERGAADARAAVESTASAKDAAERRAADLRRALEVGEQEEGRLRRLASEHESVHGEIDDLYEKVFGGPTPGFEGEDERERRFYDARHKHEAVKTRVLSVRAAGRKLLPAQRDLKKAIGFIGEAKECAQRSVLSFDDAIYYLRFAGEKCASASMTVNSATQGLAPMGGEMATIKRQALDALHRAEMKTDPLFSRQKILSFADAMGTAVTEAKENVAEMSKLMAQNEKDLMTKLKGTARTLEESRQVLQEVRQGIFEEVAGFGEAAPAYTECCDRADSFCMLPAYPDDEADGTSNEQEAEPQQVQEHGENELSATVSEPIHKSSTLRRAYTSEDLE